MLKSNRLCSFMNTLHAVNPHPTQFGLCFFKIMKYVSRNLPNTKKFKYTWMVYHSSGMEIDGITYQSQACERCKSDVQKCMYFKQMVQRHKLLKTPRSCNAIFLIRSLCYMVLSDMLLPSPSPLRWMMDHFIHIYVCVCVCVCVCIYITYYLLTNFVLMEK